MRKHTGPSSTALWLIMAALLLCGHASADELASLQLLKISPSDERAVVKLNNEMRVIKPGDVIVSSNKGTTTKVAEITEGRLVLEESGPEGTETVILHLEKDEKGNRSQSIERLRRMPPGHAQPVAPSMEK